MSRKAKVVGKGQHWSQVSAEKARADHKYIKIGGTGGHLVLSGAPKRWEKSPTDVYVSSLRVAGNPLEIRQVFTSLGHNVDDHLAQAFTAQNFQTTMKAAYDAEVAAYKQYKKQKDALKAARGGPEVHLGDLQYYIDHLAQAVPTAKTVAASPRRRAAAKARKGKSLLDRVRALKAGKVLDVSKMKADGTGAKSIKAPTAKSKKFGVPGLAIVSDSAAQFDRAMDMLGPEYAGKKQEYRTVTVQRTTVAQAPLAQAPLGTVLGSPVRSPLAGLPTLPVSPRL
jgi:hypothetical protein